MCPPPARRAGRSAQRQRRAARRRARRHVRRRAEWEAAILLALGTSVVVVSLGAC